MGGKRSWTPLGVLAWIVAGAAAAFASEAAPPAEQTLGRIGASRGICVVLADRPGEEVLELARQSDLVLFVQTSRAAAAKALRASADRAGLLGTRVTVHHGPWSRIPLADRLADAAIVTGSAVAAVHRDDGEVRRVVRPLGRIVYPDREVVIPYPAGVDDWTHPYHGPDNNPLALDKEARAPFLTQFLAEPYFVPFPEVTVTAAGRVFKAFGHVGYKRRDWEWLNSLVAINGYNGTLLWKRPLEEGFNIHRNTMVATPEALYVADSRSCKKIDAASGEVLAEIVAPHAAAGRVWKWMAIRDGILYALVGGQEVRDPALRGERTEAGWPWRPMTPAYDSEKYEWGFGRTFFARDLKSGKILWLHNEVEPVDGRAVAMSGGRIFFYSDGKWLGCLDALEGKVVWRNSDADLLTAIGPHGRAQNPQEGFSTTAYMKSSDKAVFFAGPQRPNLLAASTKDGRLLWQKPHGNYQLVVRDEGLYAMGRTEDSLLIEPLTGEVKQSLGVFRGNCTRATGSIDSIFTRGHLHGGSTRLSIADHRVERIAPMRPDCHDGVIIAGGMLYWGPWMCDCSLSLVGLVGLAPAEDYAFQMKADDPVRLARLCDPSAPVAPLPLAAGDWPSYRADNRRSAAAGAAIAERAALAWQFEPPGKTAPTAPVTGGGMVFASGADGAIRALDAATGSVRWTAYTEGPLRFPPAIDQGRLFAGSGDGCVYAFEAASGKPLWRFQAAPVDRRISLYGQIASTWPIGSGVLAAGGKVYCAAGIAAYDGTHLFALDAASGRLAWHNGTSGRMLGDDRPTGVSVQGHLLLDAGRLCMAGGNVVSPAVYDPRDGRCLNTLDDEWAKAPRGRDLFLIAGQVTAFDRPLYAPKEYWTGRYFARYLLQAQNEHALVRATLGRLGRFDPAAAAQKEPKPVWESMLFEQPEALALGSNAVVACGKLKGAGDGDQARFGVAAYAIDDGRVLWQEPLEAMPAIWGMALDSQGRVVIALEGGGIVCFEGR